MVNEITEITIEARFIINKIYKDFINKSYKENKEAFNVPKDD